MKRLNQYINDASQKIRTTNECYSCDPGYIPPVLSGEGIPQEEIPKEEIPTDPGNLVQSAGRSYEFGTAPEIQIGTMPYKVREDIYEILKKHKDEKRNNMRFDSIVEVRPYERYVVARIYGGLNGKGCWECYLEDINKLIKDINKVYHTWVVQILNDCCDDVFTLEIGVRWTEKEEKTFIKNENK